MLISMKPKSLILVPLDLLMIKEVLLKLKKEDSKFTKVNGVQYVTISSMKNQLKLPVNKWSSITVN
jgi:hypothetical protein